MDWSELAVPLFVWFVIHLSIEEEPESWLVTDQELPLSAETVVGVVLRTKVFCTPFDT